MELVAATLCTVMGADCKKIMNSLPTLSADDKKNPKRIIQELRTHFVPQRNVLYERFMFNSTTQKQNESIDEFVVRLRQSAESCEFENLKDSLIRDRVVIGTTDEAGRERLLRERPVPDLNRVIESLRAAEVSRSHKLAMSGKPETAAVDYADKRKKSRHQGHRNHKNKQISQEQTPQRQPKNQTKGKYKPSVGSQGRCKWCAQQADHVKKNCPAREATCFKCSKVGHFAEACYKNKSVYEVENESQSPAYSETFLGEVNSINDDFWSTDIQVNNQTVNFKLDSGSKVTLISDHTPWLSKVKLQKSNGEFKGPGGISLSHLIRGQISNATLRIGEKSHSETVYVMQGQSKNLLSKSAIQALELLVPAPTVYSVETSPDFPAEYPKLFSGLGLLKEPYKIQLHEDAVPVCLYTPRRVPHPLLPKVKVKLEKMVKQGVISPVTAPTDWCSGMVTPKPNGDIRICVDLTNLNRAVRREIHPMASVDENLAKLQNSKVFTKLDANSGFWQIPLENESRLLTTFVTPSGRFCFNRLPFGISSAPEIFQRTMSQILEGLDGVICHMDDILIHGPTDAVHNDRVRQVLARLQEAGITLNDKCTFSKRRITFLGHVITDKGIEACSEKTKAVRDFPRPTNLTELQSFNRMVNQLVHSRSSQNQ